MTNHSNCIQKCYIWEAKNHLFDSVETRISCGIYWADVSYITLPLNCLGENKSLEPPDYRPMLGESVTSVASDCGTALPTPCSATLPGTQALIPLAFRSVA